MLPLRNNLMGTSLQESFSLFEATFKIFKLSQTDGWNQSEWRHFFVYWFDFIFVMTAHRYPSKFCLLNDAIGWKRSIFPITTNETKNSIAKIMIRECSERNPRPRLIQGRCEKTTLSNMQSSGYQILGSDVALLARLQPSWSSSRQCRRRCRSTCDLISHQPKAW